MWGGDLRPFDGIVMRVANVGVEAFGASAVGLDKRCNAAFGTGGLGFHQGSPEKIQLKKKAPPSTSRLDSDSIFFSDGKATSSHRRQGCRGQRRVLAAARQDMLPRDSQGETHGVQGVCVQADFR